jgi:SsrA-binding protein
MSAGVKIIAVNRRAHFDYAVEERYECGVALAGTEVKSVKDGRISFQDAWAEVVNGEIWVNQWSISEYPFASAFSHDPNRKKKLLLHKAEIKRIHRKVEQKRFTLIPLEFYLKKGRVKIELGHCKGKTEFDKRDSIKQKDMRRDLARDLRDRNR